MNVQVLVVLSWVLLGETFGASIQAQSPNTKEGPIPNEIIVETSSTDLVQTLPSSTVSPFTSSLFVPNVSFSVTAPSSTEIVSTVITSTTTTAPPPIEKTPKLAQESSRMHINNAKLYAKMLHGALSKDVVDTEVIINILAHSSHAQRLEIAEEYEILHKTKLTEDAENKLRGWFRELVLALLTPLPEFYAKELFKAMYGSGTDEDALMEILCTLSNQEIKNVAKAYEENYGATLESHIEQDTSGYFKELLVALAKATRDESETVDKKEAVKDAKKLLQAGTLKLGTDESVFIDILTHRNLKHLTQVFDEYHSMTKHHLESTIEHEFSGFIRRALLTIVKHTRNPSNYFSERLHASMAGSGTNNQHLIRIITTRSNIDIDLVKVYYLTNWEVSLEDAIIDDTSGDFKNCLVELVKNIKEVA